MLHPTSGKCSRGSQYSELCQCDLLTAGISAAQGCAPAVATAAECPQVDELALLLQRGAEKLHKMSLYKSKKHPHSGRMLM